MGIDRVEISRIPDRQLPSDPRVRGPKGWVWVVVVGAGPCDVEVQLHDGGVVVVNLLVLVVLVVLVV